MIPTFASLAARLLIILPGGHAYAVPADMEAAAQTLISRATRKGGPALIPLAEADAETRRTALRNLLGHTEQTYRQSLAAGPLSPVCNPVHRRGGARPGAGRPPVEDPKTAIAARVSPTAARWAQAQVKSGRFRSVGAYIDHLIRQEAGEAE